MSREKKILVVGTGTIGEPLIGLLSAYQADLGIDEVIFHKRTPLLTDRSKVRELIRRGAKLATDPERASSFEELEVGTPVYTTEQALEEASVVIDCTPAGNKMKEDLYNDFAQNTDLFIAQGSEFGFGKMYARGINDRALIHGEDKFIQVVSCNTHNISVLIDTLALGDGQDNLRQGRFLCVRRSNDLSQDTGFIPSPEVGKHGDPIYGTHHARDAYHLFKTMGLELNLFSSALKLNTQYMHVIQYHLQLNKSTSLDSVLERIRANDRIATTYKKTANSVFSFGRDHGFFGRILNQTVIPTETLAVIEGGKKVVGYCFTPQDGNSLLSSLSAATWLLYPDDYEDRIQCLRPFFNDEV